MYLLHRETTLFFVALKGRITPVGGGCCRGKGWRWGVCTHHWICTGSTCSPIGPGDAALKSLSKGKSKKGGQCSGEHQRTPDMELGKPPQKEEPPDWPY